MVIHKICIFYLFLLLLISPSYSSVCALFYEEPLTRNTNWTYQIITESEAQGSGSYKGTSFSIKKIDGRVTIEEIDDEKIVIEDYQEIIYNKYGTGFFKQNRTTENSQALTYTIDRKDLTVISYQIRNSTDEESEKIVIAGKPAIYFISTSLKHGQTTKYYWGGQIILCLVTEEYNQTETNPTMITLRYSGPTKVMIETVTRFPEDGTAECKFNFDKPTGILMSYEVNETASYRGGSCCAIEVKNTEKFMVNTASFWKTKVGETDTTMDSIPEIDDEQHYKEDTQAETQINYEEIQSDNSHYMIHNFILIILVIAILTGLIYANILRGRKIVMKSCVSHLG